MQELKGYVTDIIYRNDVNFYTVFEVETEDGTVTCTGSLTEISIGENFAMQGEYRVHPTYGEQFAVDSFRIIAPEGAQQIERYLASGAVKGIGQALARRIVKKFGGDTLKIMEEQPERLSEIKGISLQKAREISAQMENRRDLRDAILYLQQFGISNTIAVRIYQAYGAGLYQVLRENPYRLAEDIQGIGFAKADEIASRTGIRPDSDHRVRSGILYVLSEVLGEGSCYYPRELLDRRASSLLRIPDETVDVQIDNLAMDRKLYVKKNGTGSQVYPENAYYKEQQTAQMLLDLDSVRPQGADDPKAVRDKIRLLAGQEEIELDELQEEAVFRAVENAVLIISGGPGTGKTTTINTIIRYFKSEEMEVLLAAPTGRAAKRMTEATGGDAVTIHRLLGVHPMRETGGNDRALSGKPRPGIVSAGAGSGASSGRDSDFENAVFEKNRDNPLEADVIIVDEMSMVDMFLMNSLLRAIIPGTRLIMVGDVDQLPSVGPGQVLRDLIDSGVFHSVRLTKIFRQAAQSDIIMNAHAIHEGRMIRLDTKSRDFFFLERDNPQVIYKHIVELMRDRLPGYVHCRTADIQVLTPMRKGMLGVEKLNQVLQMTLNPKSDSKKELRHGDVLFREGDKVMQTRNDYQLHWRVLGRYSIPVDEGDGVFNGDFGVVQKISAQENTMTVCFDENRIVEYTSENIDELDLSYAVTVHKSQGSEYPAVILPLLSGPPALFSRNLLYTAVTRAKNCVMILGSRDTVKRMIDNAGENERRTGLADRIREAADRMKMSPDGTAMTERDIFGQGPDQMSLDQMDPDQFRPDGNRK